MTQPNQIDTPVIARVACIGGGVIGGGWAARFLLGGSDVAVYDPDEAARRTVREVLANAEAAYAELTQAPLPPKGKLTFCDSLEEAVAGADWVQESVPERIDVKRPVLAQIDAAALEHALIGSSTSGLLPSDLQVDMARPGRFFVAHPYNPVYLLPLVEVVGGEKTAPETVERATAALKPFGMKAVPIRKEIDAFVGDRLLEALWREALWLIKDDVCDVETLDDVIRYSFGLRWAQMGVFQTYYLAGGEAGMRHFLAQFGPALKLPWTKLMDVVELDDALVDKIADQSESQNAGRSLRELERIRDENLVGILRTLRGSDGGRGWGAGHALAKHEAALEARAPAPDTTIPTDRPLPLLRRRVPRDWIDYNGHMTEHRYLQVFGDTTDALLARIGVDAEYVAQGRSYYTVETHLRHLGEAVAGDELTCTTQLLHVDEKRLQVFHALHAAGGEAPIATAEQMLLHVDSKAGRAVPAADEVRAGLDAIVSAQASLPMPAGTGRAVGDRPKP